MENSNKTETAIVIVFTLILVAIIGTIAFSTYSSETTLESNSINQSNVVQNQTPKNNTGSNTTKVPGTSTETTTEPIATPPTPVLKETEIASFSTNIYDKDANRVYNIGLAIGKINGAIVKKGETFSFNDTVGPMGEKQGFKKALGFDNDGNKIQLFGGGMCQISSTIYNAALMANLEIIERHPHSRRVYYVAKDKDATIYYGTLDFKFKNNTNDDIKIIATNDNSNVTIKLNKITSGT